jgi:hypothetical protein
MAESLRHHSQSIAPQWQSNVPAPQWQSNVPTTAAKLRMGQHEDGHHVLVSHLHLLPKYQGPTTQQKHSEQNLRTGSTLRPCPPRHHRATNCTKVPILSNSNQQILLLARGSTNERYDSRVFCFILLHAPDLSFWRS